MEITVHIVMHTKLNENNEKDDKMVSGQLAYKKYLGPWISVLICVCFNVNDDVDDLLISSLAESVPKKVFIGGVPPQATEDDIKAVFSQFGVVSIIRNA